MPINNSWTAPAREAFANLPEDTYQVFIEDVEIVEGTAYQSTEKVDQIKFTFQVLDDETFEVEGKINKTKGRKLFKNISPVISAAGPGKNPANFNLIYEAVYKKTPYQDQIKTITSEILNDFIGRQLRLNVKIKTNEQGLDKNKIDGFMRSKTDVVLPEGFKIPIKDSDIPIIDENEEKQIDLKDIPF